MVHGSWFKSTGPFRQATGPPLSGAGVGVGMLRCAGDPLLQMGSNGLHMAAAAPNRAPTGENNLGDFWVCSCVFKVFYGVFGFYIILKWLTNDWGKFLIDWDTF